MTTGLCYLGGAAAAVWGMVHLAPTPKVVAGFGILLILLAFWVSGSDRVYALRQRAYLILFWVGFMAIFKRITQIMLAFGIRRVGRAS